MKIDLLDSYNVRARLCPSIILLGPIGLTMFLCFEEIYTFASSAILICILIAFTNYVPILQRYINKNIKPSVNYAAEYLHPSNAVLDEVSKKRYYKKLAEIDESFSAFNEPSDSPEFYKTCESAVLYLRNNTRAIHLVQEENINYGFCKNMLASKAIGIIINILLAIGVIIYSFISFGSIQIIPLANKLSVLSNVLFLLFWIFGINKEMKNQAAKKYAIALVSSLDVV